MSVVCPTITASDSSEYARQLNQVKSFAKRIHIDFMDGIFTEKASIPLNNLSWPSNIEVDIHLMAKNPMGFLEALLRLKPNLVIIQNEAEAHHMLMAAELHKAGIKAGLCLLQETPVDWAEQIIHSFDHVLVFSGHLGYHGGKADLALLDKVKKINTIHGEAEIGWDGGINDQNARDIAEAGVDVLDVGAYVQDSIDPKSAYVKIRQQIGEA